MPINSILDSVKKSIGIDKEYAAFDPDIIMHINSVLATLNQLGVGPESGFSIEDSSTTWNELIGDDPRYNSVKTYVFLKVRTLFDPPTASHLMTAMNEQIREFEWRIQTLREEDKWQSSTKTT